MRNRGWLLLPWVIACGSSGDDASGSEAGGNGPDGRWGVVWVCACEELRGSFAGDTTSVIDVSDRCGRAGVSPRPSCDCRETDDPCFEEAEAPEIPTPVSIDTCTGMHDGAELGYRTTVYNTLAMLTECWETLDGATASGEFMFELPDDGYDARTCSIDGDRAWRFETVMQNGALAASASLLSIRVDLVCASE